MSLFQNQYSCPHPFAVSWRFVREIPSIVRFCTSLQLGSKKTQQLLFLASSTGQPTLAYKTPAIFADQQDQGYFHALCSSAALAHLAGFTCKVLLPKQADIKGLLHDFFKDD